jgi:O-antigen/teichoic acid export membrane protein
MGLTRKTVPRLSLGWRTGIASADQALLSAMGFLISILLIRTVSKEEYGYYSIALPVSLLLVALQNGIVNAPLTVLLASKKGAERREYVSSLCFGQFLVVLPTVGVGLIAFEIFRFPGLGATVNAIAAALCASAGSLLYREFLRSFLFAEEDSLAVLRMDALYVALSACGLSILYLISGIRVDTVFLLLGASALLAALPFGRGRGWSFPPRSVSKSYRENWKFGKWSLLGVCVTHVQSYSCIYLLGIFSGSVAVADLSAARLLLMPMMLIQAGWGRIAIPHGSRLREDGQNRLFFMQQVRTSILVLLCITLYAILLMLCSDLLGDFLFSGKYANSFRYVLAWGVICAIGFLSVNANYGLQAMMKFDVITKWSFIVMLVTVGSSYFFIRSYGIAGGLAAMIIGETLMAIVLWYCFARTVFTVGRSDG